MVHNSHNFDFKVWSEYRKLNKTNSSDIQMIRITYFMLDLYTKSS